MSVMSHYITQNGLVVTCDDPACPCNAKPRPKATPYPHTAGAVAAADEERWFDDLCDAVEDYLRLYVEHRDCPKADEPALEKRLHAAKADIVARFYVSGWAA